MTLDYTQEPYRTINKYVRCNERERELRLYPLLREKEYGKATLRLQIGANCAHGQYFTHGAAPWVAYGSATWYSCRTASFPAKRKTGKIAIIYSQYQWPLRTPLEAFVFLTLTNQS